MSDISLGDIRPGGGVILNPKCYIMFSDLEGGHWCLIECFKDNQIIFQLCINIIQKFSTYVKLR